MPAEGASLCLQLRGPTWRLAASSALSLTAEEYAQQLYLHESLTGQLAYSDWLILSIAAFVQAAPFQTSIFKCCLKQFLG